ncbi:MAG: Hsp20/alpha crystallin family protein [Halofilum sp. (in: g-proteobacteria)]|nr:Hsp20/alpha crystallin family protein [Halofilum sp. (in: g-proteobacteria)]
MAAKKEDVGKSSVVPIKSGGGIASLRNEINRLFDHFTHGGRRGEAMPDVWSRDPFAGFEWPAVTTGERTFGRADLSETDTGYELQVDLPGMKKEDLSVDLADGMLSISGERSDEREDKRKGYYLCERSYGSVQRSFRVPESVDPKKIKAEFKDGVLTLAMPRSEEARKKTRQIEVE